MQVTIYKNIKETKTPFYTTPEVIVSRIKTGKSKEIVNNLRSESDKKKRSEIKSTLPSICFSGTFKERGNENIITHSGLVAIDFDHLNGRLQEFKDRICKDSHTYMAFVSPSGDGLKVIVKIPDSVKTHAFSCDALSDYYKEESLDNFKDVARVCYESYDPEIYFNPESNVFITLKETQIIKRTIETTDIITDFDAVFDNITKWLDRKCEYYQDGSKHSFLVKIASACLRFGIPEFIAVQKTLFKYIHTASSVDPKDFENIFHRVYRNYSHVGYTAHFDKTNIAYETTTKTILSDAIFDITLPLKDVILLDNVRESMLNTFYNGHSRGESTMFKTIDDNFRMKRKHLILMHGIMNHGKSAFITQVCLLMSVYYGYKWAFFSPEQDPPDDFYDELIHTLVGKSTQPYHNNQMTVKEYTTACDFVKDHFFYIFPENEAPTPEYINERFEEVIKKYKVDGCVIDPYNQMDNDIKKTGGRDDQYLSVFLTKQKRFAQKHNIFMIVITHPKGSLTKNSAGDYQCPDIYDLAGGAMWGNKSDDILCTYRPLFSSNKSDNSVKFISQKIKKRKLCGSPGEVDLFFDVMSNRYMELSIHGKTSPFDCGKVQEIMKDNLPEQKKMNINVNYTIESNKDFDSQSNDFYANMVPDEQSPF